MFLLVKIVALVPFVPVAQLLPKCRSYPCLIKFIFLVKLSRSFLLSPYETQVGVRLPNKLFMCKLVFIKVLFHVEIRWNAALPGSSD